ncbi:DUF2523 domain-containing protein [Aeromonas sp. 23P]|jgi:hypothetical protein|uniref:DUF2523 domain-containing protein n=1 Tax=Aeromonas TaxID=642 RepID=UPI001F2C735F|nr:DUF2523 domain-containing protein [Aeromonas veronii]MCF5857595.1 DUF2523 domain-containing protein [Aeromonas veronii]
MNIAAWLLSIAGPIVTRVLIQLGVGVVSYAAVVAAVNTLISRARGNYDNLPSDILQVFAIAGFNDAFGIVVAAIMARLSIQVWKRFQIK